MTKGLESSFERRTRLKEERMENARLSRKYVEYSMLVDELGTMPVEPESYQMGIQERKDLLDLIESLESSNTNQKNKSQKRKVMDYTIAQYEKDKNIIGYVQVMGIDIKGDNNLQAKRKLLKDICGYNRLRIAPGEEKDSFADIEVCDPSRINRVTRGVYQTAIRRIQEYERRERSLVD